MGLGVKPILLNLQTSPTTYMLEVMTSSKMVGEDHDAMAEIARIAEGLTGAGFKVIRKKVETVGWHPQALLMVDRIVAAGEVLVTDPYFECHFNVIMTRSGDLDFLKSFSARRGIHLSLNIAKQHPDGSGCVMLTHRSATSSADTFRAEVADIKSALMGQGFTVDEDVVEFSLFDDDVAHDADWIAARQFS